MALSLEAFEPTYCLGTEQEQAMKARMSRNSRRTVAMVLVALAVGATGCGGGGGNQPSGELAVDFDYPQITQVQLFAPFSVTPVLDGLQGRSPTVLVHDVFAGSGMPQGWTYDARTGTVSGVATQPGQFSLGANLTVAGVEGNLTDSFVVDVVTDIRVSYPGSAPTLSPGATIPPRSPSLEGIQAGDSLSYAPMPGLAPPAGVTIHPITGVISGTTPTAPSPKTYTVPVQVTVTRGTYTATINAIPGYVFAVR